MRRVRVAVIACVVSLGCDLRDTTAHADGTRPSEARDIGAVQTAALTELFTVREQATALLLWRDSLHTGPVFDSLGLRAALDIATPASLVVSRVSLAELEALFAQHPDGWAAVYATYPGIPGLVEVGPVTFAPDARSAQIVVGRSCGENCRMAWRITLDREDSLEWRVRDVGAVATR